MAEISTQDYVDLRFDECKDKCNYAIGNLEKRMDKHDSEIYVLQESRALLEGKADQHQVNIALVMTVVSIAISVLAIAIQFIKP